jgi:ParB family chromosome partitioning protein
MMGKETIPLGLAKEIPLNLLRLSEKNVRGVQAAEGIEALAADIALRGLLQSLCVRELRGEDGDGPAFEVVAGGRRFRALKYLAKKKKLAKSVTVPCVIVDTGEPLANSLAENVIRESLHPLDQFRAFQGLYEEAGQSIEEIAAAFGVTPAVVRQRLKLAAASPKLLALYASGELSLDQLIAFCVTDDRQRQETVYATLASSYDRSAYAIRRMLTMGSVRASDRRARFVGPDDYLAAGGVIARDLFEEDEGGFLENSDLLHRLVDEKLKREAGRIEAEGWGWVEAAPELAYGHSFGFGRIAGQRPVLTPEEEASYQALQNEYEGLIEDKERENELDEEVSARIDGLLEQLGAYENRHLVYNSGEMAKAGVFVSIAHDGALKIERGFVRPEHREQKLEEDGGPIRMAAARSRPAPNADAPKDLNKLPDRLLTGLLAYRTLALKAALADNPDAAQLVLLHTLAASLLYHDGFRYPLLDISACLAPVGSLAPALGESASANRLTQLRDGWAAKLPERSGDLWEALQNLEPSGRDELLAYLVSMTMRPVLPEPGSEALSAIAGLAKILSLDLTKEWQATASGYFEHVTRAQIIRAVEEAAGKEAAARIAHLKKTEMARAAEELVHKTGWLPWPLRAQGAGNEDTQDGTPVGPDVGPSCEDGSGEPLVLDRAA